MSVNIRNEFHDSCDYQSMNAVGPVEACAESFRHLTLLPDQLDAYTDNDISHETHSYKGHTPCIITIIISISVYSILVYAL